MSRDPWMSREIKPEMMATRKSQRDRVLGKAQTSPAGLDGYQNGMSLYRAYFIPGQMDPTGKVTEDEVSPFKWACRLADGEDVACHHGLFEGDTLTRDGYGGGSAAPFGPNRRPNQQVLDERPTPLTNRWDAVPLKYTEKGVLGHGVSESKCCKEATKDEVRDCLRNAPYPDEPWALSGPNCQTDTMNAFRKCCLKADKAPECPGMRIFDFPGLR